MLRKPNDNFQICHRTRDYKPIQLHFKQNELQTFGLERLNRKLIRTWS